MNRVVYLCDWLPPDFGAVGQYSVLFATERARRGEHVTLVGLSTRGHSVETVQEGDGSVETIRIPASRYDKSRLFRRALWTLRTNLALLWRARAAVRRANEILFTGSPPFLIHFVVPLNLLLRKCVTYRITDFHPECLIAELGRTPPPLRWFHRLTIALRRRVDRFEVLGEDQRRRLEELGIPSDRIQLKRDPSPVAIHSDVEPLPVPETLRGRFVLLYSGNFGVAHDHETFLEGYRRHHREGSGRVGLWLNATGAKVALLERTLVSDGLPYHRSELLPLEDLPRILVAAQAHLITLRNEFVGFVLPSKVYACIESKRPILFIGSEESDVHLLCHRALASERYFQVDTGDPENVTHALETMSAKAPVGTAVTFDRPSS
ncbi:MAG TPA: glycosyltransferase [Thermoanaerobaculia bacterium]|nr:glycosyltransferase [Thermoanaerobaculia bacterium]